ncbi:MAG: cbb3-type cytochrome c oxidase N-terminal domain-containing protein [bacterium]
MLVQLHNTLLKKVFFIPVFMMAATSQAQDAATATKDTTNLLEMAMIITAIVLVGVIWLLAQVLLTLSRSILKKRKGELGLKSMMILIFSSVLSSSATAQESNIMSGLSTGTGNYGGMSALSFYALTSVIAIELIVIFYLGIMTRRAFRDLSGEADQAIAKVGEPGSLAKWWNNFDKKWMTKAVPVEKEADVLLDHDYDGIRELDNALPPWWKYGFYVTIVVGVIYLFLFHVTGTGKNPEQEYAAEMTEAQKMEEAYKAKTKTMVDENNITMADADGIAAGKALYTQSCVACHGANGEGGIGPNLTDNYWIHGGSLNKIYQTIKIGYPEKGMQSWQSMYSPVQMKNLTSYVKSIVGTKPANPKAPQGDIDAQAAQPTK